MVDIWKAKPPQTPKEMEERCQEYFEECDVSGKPYAITGVALVLGVNRRTLLKWRNDLTPQSKYFWRKAIIKKALLKCEDYTVQYLYKGGMSPAGPIFALKNYGWRDEKSLDLTTAGRQLGYIALPGQKSEQVPIQANDKELRKAKK